MYVQYGIYIILTTLIFYHMFGFYIVIIHVFFYCCINFWFRKHKVGESDFRFWRSSWTLFHSWRWFCHQDGETLFFWSIHLPYDDRFINPSTPFSHVVSYYIDFILDFNHFIVGRWELISSLPRFNDLCDASTTADVIVVIANIISSRTTYWGMMSLRSLITSLILCLLLLLD